MMPVKLQLTSGLALEGNIGPTGPFPCTATFGEVSIPLSAIRGIRLHEVQTSPSNPLPAATIILNNNDNLTVFLQVTQIQIKTAWGLAIVDLPHVRSLLLTQDDAQWQQAGDRWILAPAEKPVPAEDASTEAKVPAADTAPAIPPQAPQLDVPPTIGVPTS
jgi:hypothetical protein